MCRKVEKRELEDTIQITGTVNNTVNLDGFTTNNVEYEGQAAIGVGRRQVMNL